VIVHGDTGSAIAGARAAAARGIPVSHVEAGLRTHRLDNPWPEEGYRREIDAMADQLFAPTPLAASHLVEEQAAGRIFVTGNSGIDALHAVLARLEQDNPLRHLREAALPKLPPGKPVVLVTLHRRESIGSPLRRMCAGLRRLAEANMHLVVTLHPNPAVRRQLQEELGGRNGIQLVQPLAHPLMVRMMQRADLIITDSGGVQEEAPSLGTPVLVAREVTERPEGVALGLACMVRKLSRAHGGSGQGGAGKADRRVDCQSLWRRRRRRAHRCRVARGAVHRFRRRCVHQGRPTAPARRLRPQRLSWCSGKDRRGTHWPQSLAAEGVNAHVLPPRRLIDGN
jgi:UDP-N-acetylglucosamine 2-epimerase